jgi:hypothetical protein
MAEQAFYALYNGNSKKPLTVIPAITYEEHSVRDYFLTKGYRESHISQAQAKEILRDIEVGIGCFAMDGSKIVLDEDRREAAMDDLASLVEITGQGRVYDPIGVLIRD